MTPEQTTIALERYNTLNQMARLLDDAGLDIISYHSHMILNTLATGDLTGVNRELYTLRDHLLGYPVNFAREFAASKYDKLTAEVRSWQDIAED